MVMDVAPTFPAEYSSKITWKIAKDKIPTNDFINISTPKYFVPSYPIIKFRLSFEFISYKNYIINIRLDQSWDITGQYTLVIESAGKTFTGSISKGSERSTCCCCLKNILDEEEYFVDGFLVLKLTINLTISSHVYPFFEQESLSKELWNDDEKDFTIIIGDKELKVHKLILRISSPVFAGMLKSGMKEAIENKVEIKGFDFEVIETAMKFCYGLSILKDVNPAFAMSAIQFAEIYNIKHLKKQTERFLTGIVNGHNVFELLKCATNTNSPNLEGSCKEFLNELSENGLSVNDTDTELDENVFCHVCETV